MASANTFTHRAVWAAARVAREAGRRASAGDEAAQRIGLELDFLDAVLDEVADADDADEDAVLDDGQVTKAMLGHACHQIAYGVFGNAGDDLARHQLVDRHRQQRGALLGEGMDDVALGEDAGDPAPVLADQEGADAAGLELAHRRPHRGIGPDRRDVAALGAQDGFDVHGRPPDSVNSSILTWARPFVRQWEAGEARLQS